MVSVWCFTTVVVSLYTEHGNRLKTMTTGSLPHEWCHNKIGVVLIYTVCMCESAVFVCVCVVGSVGYRAERCYHCNSQIIIYGIHRKRFEIYVVGTDKKIKYKKKKTHVNHRAAAYRVTQPPLVRRFSLHDRSVRSFARYTILIVQRPVVFLSGRRFLIAARHRRSRIVLRKQFWEMEKNRHVHL